MVLLAFWLLMVVLASGVQAEESIELYKTIVIPGNHRDQSALSDELQPGIPHDQFGGISALEYLGRDDLYLALPDRGPLDGAVDYTCRVHVVRISIEERSFPDFQIQKSIVLRDGERPFSGLHSRFESTDDRMWRLDPEGIRVQSGNRFFLTDEYGPHLLEFDLGGQLISRFPVPKEFRVATPAKTKAQENANNQSGRQGNRGLEGLAVAAEHHLLFGLFQSPLLQDCARNDSDKPVGLHCRLVEFDLTDNQCRNYIYRLDHPKYKLNEILAIGNDQFLVIERDGKAGRESKFKRIVKINLASATAIEPSRRLSSENLDHEIVPVKKETFIDLLDDRFGMVGNSMPEKIESLALGPQLKDGRQTLLVVSDNDFKREQPTFVYCFAVEPEVLRKTIHQTEHELLTKGEK